MTPYCLWLLELLCGAQQNYLLQLKQTVRKDSSHLACRWMVKGKRIVTGFKTRLPPCGSEMKVRQVRRMLLGGKEKWKRPEG